MSVSDNECMWGEMADMSIRKFLDRFLPVGMLSVKWIIGLRIGNCQTVQIILNANFLMDKTGPDTGCVWEVSSQRYRD